jgi:hypothetical protein
MPAKHKPNVPGDWEKSWPHGVTHVNPLWPGGGRDTLYPPYEAIAPTSTVGGYRDALRRVGAGDPTLPHDFASYLAQRVPFPVGEQHHPDRAIDRRGLLGEAPESPL